MIESGSMYDKRLKKKRAMQKKGMLSGGQAKLDKNKNNKLDAQDFKILRAEKAKGRGQGLQDEKMKPGKVKPVKAVLGIATMGLLGAKMLKDKKKSAMAVPGVGAAAAIEKKKKEMLGKKKGGMFKGYSKVFETAAKAGQKNTGTSTIVGVKPNPKKSVAKSKRKTFKSMEEMRKAKGFKPGETASEFNKRRMALATAKKAAKATRIGKIVLPIAAAGVAAQQYLKSKMKKKQDKNKKTLKDFREQKKPGVPSEKTRTINKALNKLNKKMGGGMMQKYAEGGSTAQQRRMGRKKLSPGPMGRAGRGVAKLTRRAGIPSLPGKRKEDSSVTLGKFMAAKTKALNESVAAGGMKRERVTQGSRMRRKEDFIKDVAAGKYKKPSKDAAYYKSIGLTGERGDRAVKDFFKPESLKSRNQKVVLTYKSVGGSVTVKTKLGRNKPTKMY